VGRIKIRAQDVDLGKAIEHYDRASIDIYQDYLWDGRSDTLQRSLNCHVMSIKLRMQKIREKHCHEKI